MPVDENWLNVNNIVNVIILSPIVEEMFFRWGLAETCINSKTKMSSLEGLVAEFNEERCVLVVGIDGEHYSVTERLYLLDRESDHYCQKRKEKSKEVHEPVSVGFFPPGNDHFI